ncbi:MAG TPA: sugar phosphate nucleotidyltransferase [Terriglobia bacterium]|nr:sugar phosphate nucleotidyltransferase [Terriglobia bacterium]
MPRKHRDDSAFAHAYAVILAGGSGTRFWPLSRRRHPKQLLELFGRGTLLEQTAARIRDIIPPEHMYIFTNEIVKEEIIRRHPRIPRRQIIAEPAARNTAPTIGLAAHELLRRDPDAIMVVLPADHVITKPGAFRRALRAACRFAASDDRSVVVGLKPTHPETGYGYVRLGRRVQGSGAPGIYAVRKFTEKPPPATAARYVASADYLWNGGMFIWRASTLIHNLERFQPRMAAGLERIAAAGGIASRQSFRRLFPRLEKISIDYALMEKIADVYAVAADIGWSDVGSWAVAYELHPKDAHGNVRPARSLCLNSRSNMIVSPRKFVVTVGVERLVIVDSGDALLVAALDRSQDVGKAVQELDRQGTTELL